MVDNVSVHLYVNRAGQQYGPYSIEDARTHLAAGNLLPTDYAFLEGMANWAPLEQVLAAAAQPVLPAGASAPQTTGTEEQTATEVRAQPAKAISTRAKKGKEKKSKLKKATSTPGFGGLLYQYRAILAVVVIIATALYIYKGYKNSAPDQGEGPGVLDRGKELEQQMEQSQKENQGKGGGTRGPGGPGGPVGPGGPGGG